MKNIPLEEMMYYMKTLLNLSGFQQKTNSYNEQLALAVSAYLCKYATENGLAACYHNKFRTLKKIHLPKTDLKYDKTIFIMNQVEIANRIQRRINFIKDFFFEKIRKYCENNGQNFWTFYNLEVNYEMNDKGDIDNIEADLYIVDETYEEDTYLCNFEVSKKEMEFLINKAKAINLDVSSYIKQKIMSDYIFDKQRTIDQNEMIVSD